MDKYALKAALKELAATYRVDVQNKLLYLQGKLVFEQADSNTDNLLSDKVWNELMKEVPKDPISQAVVPVQKEKGRSVSEIFAKEKNQDPLEVKEKQLLDRIAAFRGISLPGDYWQHK